MEKDTNIEAIEQMWLKTLEDPNAYIKIKDVYEVLYGKHKVRDRRRVQNISDAIQKLKEHGIRFYYKHPNGKGGFRLADEYSKRNNPFYIFKEGYSERRADFEKEFLRDMPFGWTSNTTKIRNYQSKAVLLSDRITRLNQISILPELLHAIKRKKPIKLGYNTKYLGEIVDVILHPAFLKEFSGRWYVCGITSDAEGNTVNKEGERTDGDRKHQVYAIDRIERFELVPSDALAYIKSEDDYWRKYFADLYGIWHNHTEPQEIVFETQNLTTYHRLRTKPIHHTQKEIQHINENEKARFSIRVIPNLELTSLLMSYREKIKVVSPESYQKTFVKSLQSTLELYGSDFKDSTCK